MRCNVPFLPLSLTIERRPLKAYRFRIRDGMVVVALVAIGLFAWQLKDRAEVYRQRALHHDQRFRYDEYLIDYSKKAVLAKKASALTARQLSEGLSKSGEVAKAAEVSRLATELESQANFSREGVAFWAHRADYHATMLKKYRYAAKYPWIPLLPDPDEP